MAKAYLQATSSFLDFSIVMEGLLGLVKADPSVPLNLFCDPQKKQKYTGLEQHESR